MKTDKDFIRELLASTIAMDYANRNCTVEDIEYDTDFTEKYEISSVRLVTLAVQLEEEYGVEIKPSDMYRLHTVEQIAGYIENADGQSAEDDVFTAPAEKSLSDLFSEL